MESFERRIATHGNQSRHVEHASDGRATAPDATSSFELAAVEGVGRKANQSCDLFAVHAAKLGKSAISVQARTGPTPGMEVSSR